MTYVENVFVCVCVELCLTALVLLTLWHWHFSISPNCSVHLCSPALFVHVFAVCDGDRVNKQAWLRWLRANAEKMGQQGRGTTLWATNSYLVIAVLQSSIPAPSRINNINITRQDARKTPACLPRLAHENRLWRPLHVGRRGGIWFQMFSKSATDR